MWNNITLTNTHWWFHLFYRICYVYLSLKHYTETLLPFMEILMYWPKLPACCKRFTRYWSRFSDAFSSPKQTILHSYQNEINAVNLIATKLFYQRKPIDTAIYEKFVCYNHKTKYTDWCPIPNDGGWGICLRMWKPVKEVALKIWNNCHVYITWSVITWFFPWTPSTAL